MIKIVVNNDFVPDYNFGYPCILHGFEEILREMYGEEFEIIVYASSEFREEIIEDYKSNIILCDVPLKKLLLVACLKKLGIKSTNPKLSEIINHILEADIIVNLYPIVFCDGLMAQKKYHFLSAVKDVIGRNLLITIGKLYGKKTVKTTCSIGPFNNKRNSTEAIIAYKYLWDVVYAREEKSRLELESQHQGIKGIGLSPDFANVMKYQKIIHTHKPPVGISVSFQIIKQWKGENSYINSITSLVIYIINELQWPVLLIPNEYTRGLTYSDIDVANEIYQNAKMKIPFCQDYIRVLDITDIQSSKLKNEIASCELLVASRYHSCIAGLSSGVPTLVVGWHWKYKELLSIYNQIKWHIPSESCDPETLISRFKEIWEERENIKQELNNLYKEVHKNVMDAGKIMFTK